MGETITEKGDIIGDDIAIDSRDRAKLVDMQ